MVHDLAVRLSSYGCTWEVGGAFEKLEKLSELPGATERPASLVLSQLPMCIHISIEIS